MKTLFIKSSSFWGGPWESFNYENTTTEHILDICYAKSGHPTPMILLLKMDFKIVHHNQLLMNYNKNYINNNIKKVAIDKNKYIYNLDDINFEHYDVVYTEDEILPEYIIKKYNKTLFCFNAIEHIYNCKYYDYFIDHRSTSFPHCLQSLRKFITYNSDGKRYNKIYIEYRTASNDECIEKFNKHFELIYNRNQSQTHFCLCDPIESGLVYWKKMGECKYYIQTGKYLEGLRVGQGFVNSATMGLINIGYCQSNSNLNFIHPLCRTQNEDAIIELIYKIENDNNLYESILEYQDYELHKLNSEFIDKLEKRIIIKKLN